MIQPYTLLLHSSPIDTQLADIAASHSLLFASSSLQMKACISMAKLAFIDVDDHPTDLCLPG